MQDKKARFRCGQLCTTPAALNKVGRAGLIRLLERHLSGDAVVADVDVHADDAGVLAALRFAAGTGLFHGIRYPKSFAL